MQFFARVIFLVLLSPIPFSRVTYAEEAVAGDDEVGEQVAGNSEESYNSFQGDDYIKYWTEYALYPKRCIV